MPMPCKANILGHMKAAVGWFAINPKPLTLLQRTSQTPALAGPMKPKASLFIPFEAIGPRFF